jgi:hypothetical protein
MARANKPYGIEACYVTISDKWFKLDCWFATEEERDAEIRRKSKHAHGYGLYRPVQKMTRERAR